jgi:hypothetical protein
LISFRREQSDNPLCQRTMLWRPGQVHNRAKSSRTGSASCRGRRLCRLQLAIEKGEFRVSRKLADADALEKSFCKSAQGKA